MFRFSLDLLVLPLSLQVLGFKILFLTLMRHYVNTKKAAFTVTSSQQVGDSTREEAKLIDYSSATYLHKLDPCKFKCFVTFSKEHSGYWNFVSVPLNPVSFMKLP